MKIYICENYSELSKKAFQIFTKKINTLKNPRIGFATGSTPLGLYEEIIKDYRKNNTSYEDITTFNLDEYIGIDKEHHASYYHAMKNTLFNHIGIKDHQINIPNGYGVDLEKECIRYSQLLKKESIDLQILGIGANGHIGFNEPNTKFNSTTHIVELDKKTIEDNARFFDSINEVPKKAITIGIKEIMISKEILLLATGENKADAVYKMIHGEVHEDLPASVLQLHNNLTIVLDKKAAYRLINS